MQITVKWVVWVMWKTHNCQMTVIWVIWKTHHCQFTVIPDAIHWQITQSGANHCQFTSDLQEITWGKWFWGRGFIYHRRHLGSMAGSQPLMILNDSQWSPLAHGGPREAIRRRGGRFVTNVWRICCKLSPSFLAHHIISWPILSFLGPSHPFVAPS